MLKALLHRRLIALVAVYLSILSSAAHSEVEIKSITLLAPHITNLVEENGKGIYQRLLSEALELAGQKTKEIFAPYKRALLLFEQGQGDCIYSFTKVLQNKLGKQNIVYTYPLGAFAYYIFTAKNSPAISDPQKLRGLRVGGVFGHNNYYQHTLAKDISLIMVNKDIQNIEKLRLNRLDAIIGALPDLTHYKPELSYDASAPLVKSFDRITCRQSERNRAFVGSVSSAMRQLKHLGVYQKIYKSLYIDFNDSDTRQVSVE